MDIAAPALSAINPFEINPGPDLNIRTYMHDLFEAYRAQGEVLETLDWRKWKESEAAGAVRAIAQDFLEAHGRGFDWVSAAYGAEFVMAATLHDLAHRAGLSPAPRFYLNFYDPFMREGLEIEMMPPAVGVAMDPLPGQAAAPKNDESQRARAQLMVAPAGDALKVVDQALITGLTQVSTFFENFGQLPLVFMGASLAMWKGLQASHHVRAGTIYRGIKNPEDPSLPIGDMRIVYVRSGEVVKAAIDAEPSKVDFFLA